ncbi:uncharacterized protein RHO17_003524 isoform 1-T2 [Thomomys bottae]
MASRGRKHHYKHSRAPEPARHIASSSSQCTANYPASRSSRVIGSLLTQEHEMRIELHNMFQKFQEDIRKKLLTKRTLKVKIRASFKNIQKKWDRVLKEQHKRRLNLYEEDIQDFSTLFRSSQRQMNNLKEEAQHLATLYQKQEATLKQSLSVYSQKIDDWKKFCGQHLKSHLPNFSDHGSERTSRTATNQTLEVNANTSHNKESEDQNLDRSPASNCSSGDSLAWALM